MKMMTKTILASVCLAATTLVAGVQAQQACTYRTPQTVDGTVRTAGGFERCGLGLQVFGFGGAIWGEECPRHEIATPTHTKCVSSDGAAVNCVQDGWLEVLRRSCECDGLVIPLIDTGIPTSCECSRWEPFGLVPKHVETPCDGPITGGGRPPEPGDPPAERPDERPEEDEAEDGEGDAGEAEDERPADGGSQADGRDAGTQDAGGSDAGREGRESAA